VVANDREDEYRGANSNGDNENERAKDVRKQPAKTTGTGNDRGNEAAN
jgi:hypothetical protein